MTTKTKIFQGNIETATIRQGRSWLKLHFEDDGARCPCCQRNVKLRRKPLSANIAVWLIWLVKNFHLAVQNQMPDKDRPQRLWIKSSDAKTAGGDYGKSRHWGLTRQKEDSVGLWQPTREGILFVQNKTTVLSHVLLYNDKFHGYSGNEISIIDALGPKYDYNELMTQPASVKMAK